MRTVGELQLLAGYRCSKSSDVVPWTDAYQAPTWSEFDWLGSPLEPPTEMSFESLFKEGRQWAGFRNASHRARRHGQLQQHRNIQHCRRQRNDRTMRVCRRVNRSEQHMDSRMKKRACRCQERGQNRKRWAYAHDSEAFSSLVYEQEAEAEVDTEFCNLAQIDAEEQVYLYELGLISA